MDMKEIPIELLEPTNFPLRVINKGSLEYMELVDQLRDLGHPLQPLLVRPTANSKYEIVNGMLRFTAACEAHLPSLPCLIKEMTDQEVIIYQIQTNSTFKQTNIIEYLRHIERLREMEDECLTLSQLAAKINKSRLWVTKVLRLKHLTVEAQQALARGELTISNASELAKMPMVLQNEYLQPARIESCRDFRMLAAKIINNYREKKQHENYKKNFETRLRPRMRSYNIIQEELNTWINSGSLISKFNCKTPLDGWKLAIQWIFRVDPDSLAERVSSFETQELKRLDAAEKRSDYWKEKGLDNKESSDYNTDMAHEN